MTLTLDPQVAQALAPIAAAMAGTMPPPVGDVATRRAALEGLIAHADTAQPTPADVTLTDYKLTTAEARPCGCAGTPDREPRTSPAPQRCTSTAAA